MSNAVARPSANDRNGADRLLDAAETLFGTHGLDGPSMRQIQLAAGSSNKFAVQYHFGGPAGLVQAILARRAPTVDVRQAQCLAALDAMGRGGDVRSLVDAFLRPLLEQTNSAGDRAYARFISALLRSSDGEAHCRALIALTPTTGRILGRLHAALPDVPHGILEERLRLLTGLVCTSVFNRITAVDAADADSWLIDDALDVAAAGLSAPACAFEAGEQDNAPRA